MATDAQILANQANAQLSTGPTSDAGKLIASHNALKHGLTATSANVVLLNDNDRAAFAEIESGLRAEIKPNGALQLLIFKRLTAAAWNLERCDRIHTSLAISGTDPLTDPDLHSTIRLLETYTRRNERTFAQAMKQLRELQAEQAFREGTLAQEEIENPTISALIPAAKLRQQWSADECARTRSEAAIVRRNLDPDFASLRLAGIPPTATNPKAA